MKVSVVIATHKKNFYLEKTLKSLTLQTEKSFQVHVVNDGGEPSTIELVNHFKDRLDIHHHWTREPGHQPCGAAATRNVGIRHAQAPRLLIVDDDCLCPFDLVAHHAAVGGNGGVIGFRRFVALDVVKTLTDKHLADIKRRIPSRPEQRHEPKHQRRMAELVRDNKWEIQGYLWTCHLGLPTEIAKSVGGMWEEMLGSGAEDQEFGLRCFRAGVRYRVLADPTVYHMDHPKCQLQINHIPQNRKLLELTKADPKIVVRNGGPLT